MVVHTGTSCQRRCQVHFLVSPIVALVGAAAFGGSGLLAAFVAGVLFETEEHMVEIERFFFQVIDGALTRVGARLATA